MEFGVDNFVYFMYPTVASYIVQAADELQAEMDPPFARGSYFIEIRRRFLTYSWTHRLIFGDLCEPIFTLVARNDNLYTDTNFARFSTRRIDETYLTFSENLAKRWPGYILNKSFNIVPSTDHVIEQGALLALLRSKNIDQYHAQKDHFFGEQARYTTGATGQFNVCYATYPRSGNSLMRKYFENVTGVATGSDMILKHSPNVALQFCGFKAEGITDSRVFINKSHFPYQLPFQWDWSTDIAVICTRFQLDADPSFFYLVFSQTHSQSFKNKLTEEPILPYWLDYQRRSSDAYGKWFRYWIDVAENTNKPVYFFRFEDILAKPEEELRELFKFILNMDDIEGSVVEQRITDVMGMGAKKNQTYKPRTGGTNRNMHNFLPEQLDYTKTTNEEIFHTFGYVKDDERIPENNTPFLDYEGKASLASVNKTNYFRELNKMAMEKRKRIPDGVRAMPEDKIHVGANAPGGFSMMSELNIMKNMGCLEHLEFST